MTELEALQKAISLCGGQSALARKIGGKVRQGHVWQWLNNGHRAPPEHCGSIEAAVGGRVTRYQLRPDVFGDAPRKPSRARQVA